MTILDKQVTPTIPSALTLIVELLAEAKTGYGSYKVVGPLLQRACGTALHQTSAFIVAKASTAAIRHLGWTARIG